MSKYIKPWRPLPFFDFAQFNLLLSLLECRLTTWTQLNRANWHACLKHHRVTMRHRIFSSCKTMYVNCRRPSKYWKITELLAGVINEQDCRAMRTACLCLNSLRIRVEARTNVTERAVISRQLQLMQERVQPRYTEDLDTDDTSCPSRTWVEHFTDNAGPYPQN